jgi:hypothetical protein
MRTFGNVMAQVRKVSNGFQDEMRNAMNTLDATSTKGSTATGQGASAAADGTVETVARNVDAVTPPSTAAPAVDPVSDRPGTTPADRAAG